MGAMEKALARRREQDRRAWVRMSETPGGTPVTVTKDDGTRIDTVTIGKPYRLDSGIPVVHLEGIGGCYSLARVALRASHPPGERDPKGGATR